MSTNGRRSRRKKNAADLLREYFDYLDGATIETFDPELNDELAKEYVEFVRHQSREGRSGGYLNRVRSGLRFYSFWMPRSAAVLAALVFLFGAWGAMGADATLAALLPIGTKAVLVGFGVPFVVSMALRVYQVLSSSQRQDMKDIRLLNYGQIVKEIATARRSALDNATTDNPNEGPISLLRLLMLSRLHFELVRSLEIDYEIFSDGVNRTDLRGEDELFRLGALSSGFTLFTALTVAPAAVTVWAVASGAIVCAFIAHTALYGIYRAQVKKMAKDQEALFRPEMTDRELEQHLGVPSIRAREFNWQKQTETSDVLEYVEWLEQQMTDFNERLKGPVVVRRADTSQERKPLMPMTDDED
ncbi:MAG: hypothetical protein AAFX52_01450 [Pseudomonadota bacterium]